MVEESLVIDVALSVLVHNQYGRTADDEYHYEKAEVFRRFWRYNIDTVVGKRNKRGHTGSSVEACHQPHNSS